MIYVRKWKVWGRKKNGISVKCCSEGKFSVEGANELSSNFRLWDRSRHAKRDSKSFNDKRIYDDMEMHRLSAPTSCQVGSADDISVDELMWRWKALKALWRGRFLEQNRARRDGPATHRVKNVSLFSPRQTKSHWIRSSHLSLSIRRLVSRPPKNESDNSNCRTPFGRSLCEAEKCLRKALAIAWLTSVVS